MKTVKCACKGSNLDKLVQPAILTIISKEKTNGYKLIQKLAENPMFCGCKPDATGIYRFLGTMEKKGLINWDVDIKNNGLGVKMYSITKEGRECLDNWVNTLQEYKIAVDKFLVYIKEEDKK